MLIAVRRQHAPYFRATASTNQRSFQKNPMTKDSFRLMYINARHLLSVDGHETVPINAGPPGGSKGIEIIRGPTEASRAIHGYYHESQTTGHADYSSSLLHHFIMFREGNVRPHRPGAERLHWRRIPRRVSHSDPRSKLTRSWPGNAGEGAPTGLAKSRSKPARCLEF